ncbi:hypothetical protein ACFSTE_09260 [Aquimarina hainanensis]|uniref:Uncharacterized protein n=1 Tax=Aquimarina hainanensis TaxID=1578017 RepID=A0ABW5N8S8_9FLAO
MIEVYVIFLADDLGNFDWVYTYPKPYYLDKKEAQKIVDELIKTEHISNSKIKIRTLWKFKNNN